MIDNKETPVIKGYQITRQGSDEITIRRTDRNGYIPLLFMLVFFTVWYWGILQSAEETENLTIPERFHNLLSEEPFLWIFVLAPLLIVVPAIIRLFRQSVLGETIHIDGSRGLVKRNNKIIANIDDYQYIDFRDGGSRGISTIALLEKSGKPLAIIAAKSPAVRELAENLKLITGKPFRVKE